MLAFVLGGGNACAGLAESLRISGDELRSGPNGLLGA